jgi:alpha-galactosidase/6-phospho-beta-glucosidase family protein
MRSFYFFLLLFVAFITKGYSTPNSILNTIENDYDWVFLIYMNGEGDLGPNAILDYEQISKAFHNRRNTVNKKIKVVVQLKRTINPSIGNTIRRFDIDEYKSPLGGLPVSDTSMTNKETLRKFIDWGTKKYTSTNYALIFWNHGTFITNRVFSKKNLKKEIKTLYKASKLFQKQAIKKLDYKIRIKRFKKHINYLIKETNHEIHTLNEIKNIDLKEISIQNINDNIYKENISLSNNHISYLDHQRDTILGILERISFIEKQTPFKKVSKKEFETQIYKLIENKTAINSFNVLTEFNDGGEPSFLGIEDIQKETLGSEINLILFDSCSMGSIEMISQFTDNENIKYIVANQLEIKAIAGVNYTSFFNSLNEPSTSPEKISTLLFEHFEKSSIIKNSSLSVYNPHQMDPLIRKINEWIEVFDSNSDNTFFRNALYYTRKNSFTISGDVNFQEQMEESIDLKRFIKEFSKKCKDSSCQKIKEISLEICNIIDDKLLITKNHSTKKPFLNGINIYFPIEEGSYILDYNDGDIYKFSQKTNWHRIIKYYYEITPSYNN